MTAKIANLAGKIRNKPTIIIAVIIIIGGSYYWYSKTKTGTGAVQYKTAIAEKGSITTSVSGSGNVTVDQLASIDPTISGTVAGLAVNVGDSVKKGQLLFAIINNDLSVSSAKSTASLQQSSNSLDSAELQVTQAKADYRAAKKDSTSTHDEKAILNKKIGVAENGVLAAQKSYAATLADYNNQQSVAGERKVLAPIDGTVSAINVKNGDDLGKSASGSGSYNAPIIIGDLATLKAEVQVNEVDIPDITLGQKVMMTFGAIEGLSVSGKVEKMDALGTITQGVVNYNVVIGFDVLDKKIKPSMSVSAKIITGIKQDVIIVPNSALKTQDSTTYIEVLKDGAQTPERRTIEIGVANNTETEIVSGINIGDNVVIQTIDPNAKTTTTTGGIFGGGGGRGGVGALH